MDKILQDFIKEEEMLGSDILKYIYQILRKRFLISKYCEVFCTSSKNPNLTVGNHNIPKSDNIVSLNYDCMLKHI